MTNHTSHPRRIGATARRAARSLLPLLIGACFSGAVAAPTSPVVVAGQATFSQQGNVFSITNTPNTVINWQSFSVNAGDVTRFIQQSADSAVLNRIVGQDPSAILGALQSNGHVFLINPNGIMFGKDARVDVNGLTASTLNLSNADFLARKNNFTGGAQSGAIVNAGQIATPSGGKVFLIAPDIENSGIIASPQGQVVLAAGRTVQLVDSSNPDLQVVVSAPDDRAVNLGQLIAQGGKVGIYGALVSQRGVVNADSAQVGENGKIVLRASGDAMLEAGSVTSATGAGRGGQITVEGQRVGMTGDARIDARGVQGGGTVLLGGGFQGKDAQMSNARQTLMGKNASISADATGSGKGGTVVLWGDESTRAYGSISARGGAQGGDGGLVETSGKYLDVYGIRVNAGAAPGSGGANGIWLLDPANIEVSNSGTVNLSDVDEFADPGSVTQIHPNTINAALPTTDVVLQATNNVVINAAIAPPLTTGKLKIDAGNNIDINAAVSTAGGAISFTANHPSYASGSGAVNMSSSGSLSSGGGAINLGGYAVNLAGPVSTGGGNFFVSGNTLARFERSVTTSGGDFAAFANTVQFGGTGTSLNTGDGTIALTASGGNLVLDTGWTLSSDSFIDILTNAAILVGDIGGAGGDVRPVLTFSPYTSSSPINVAAGTVSGLKLDPADLARFDVAGLVLGNSAMTGNINIVDAYSGGLANSLTLNTQGTVLINNPITLPSSTGSALLIDIDGPGTGLVQINGAVAADNITVVSNSMNIAAPVTANGGTGTLTLAPSLTTAEIELGAGAADSGGVLGLDNSELANLSGANLVIGGQTGASGALTVLSGGANFSGLSAASTLKVDAVEANLKLDGNLVTAGPLHLKGNDLQSLPGASAQAPSIEIDSTFGVGADFAAFNTKTSSLSVHNNRVGGLAPINLFNSGPLSLNAAKQVGSGNDGSVTILNDGAMTVPTTGLLMTGFGNLTLKASDGLTVNGAVSTGSGGILFDAENEGLLTIGASGTVASSSGNISLMAGSVVNNGSVSTASGNIAVSAATVSGSGSFSAPNGSVNGVTPPPDVVVVPPSLSQCLANSALDGCSAVLAAALNSCIANPSGPDCALVLPTLAVCIAAPATPGCSAVLPSLATCTATPSTAGCSAVLPNLATCIANPSTSGCAAVLPSLNTCIATPTASGCSVVLPALSVCVSSPATPGCSVVLPTLAVCIASPATAGCSAVLPSLVQCAANPVLPGCQVVLPSLAACTATPALAGCAAVLPSLNACIATPTLAGCSAVLPSLSACIASPALAGCSAILPSLAFCTANPAQAGCNVVLPSLATCVASPATAGCSAVLPPLAICVANPAAPGCSVVLPSLPTCISVPTTTGCAVVLPTLAQCSVNPTVAGCQVVLPGIAACVSNPALPGCSVVLPTLSQCVANPALAGCSAVLPTLSQCTASPSLSGCAVVLPTLAQCTASPTLQGCSAVLPPVSTCVTNPSAPGCQVVVPPAAQAPAGPGNTAATTVVTTINTSVNTAINTSTGAVLDKAPDKKDSKGDDKIGAAPNPLGEKNDVRKKTYCN